MAKKFVYFFLFVSITVFLALLIHPSAQAIKACTALNVGETLCANGKEFICTSDGSSVMGAYTSRNTSISEIICPDTESPGCGGTGTDTYSWVETGNTCNSTTGTITSTITQTITEGATPPATTVTEIQTTAAITQTISTTETVTQAAGCSKKSQGDANCDNKIDTVDLDIWRCQISNSNGCGNQLANAADFDGKSGVTINDFEIWRRTYQSTTTEITSTPNTPTPPSNISPTSSLPGTFYSYNNSLPNEPPKPMIGKTIQEVCQTKGAGWACTATCEYAGSTGLAYIRAAEVPVNTQFDSNCLYVIPTTIQYFSACCVNTTTTSNTKTITLEGPGSAVFAVIDQDSPDSRDTSGYLQVGDRASIGTYPGGPYRSLFKFNLASIPTNATIVSAKLTLSMYDFDSTRNEMQLHRITQAWDPTTVSWKNAPTYALAITASFPTSTYRTFVPVTRDITSTVKDWVSSPSVNFGFIAIGKYEYTWSRSWTVNFNSTDTNIRPKLVIEYTTP